MNAEERIKREGKTWQQLAHEYYVEIKEIPGATYDKEYQRKVKPISSKLWIPQKRVLQILKDYVVVSRKKLREKLVHPTNTKSVAVYDFIKELLAEKKP